MQARSMARTTGRADDGDVQVRANARARKAMGQDKEGMMGGEVKGRAVDGVVMGRSRGDIHRSDERGLT